MFQTLTILINNFPLPMAQWTQAIVTPVWQTLVQSADMYLFIKKSIILISKQEIVSMLT